ncbi:MAG: hypothetical protein GY866_11170 [Proteobacteria bacterium]|nr:hypothetical protein [Pseudomonadota bacterium]
MKTILKILAVLSVMVFAASSAYAVKDPVGVLFKTKGKVEYTKNGKKWKKVRRNKFLFVGYQIRTGSDGSGKITIKETGENLEIGPNALIEVSEDGLDARKGEVESTKASGKLMTGLMKKFSKSQSYTTVRRSHKKNRKLRVLAAKTMTMSEDHPYVVWSNIGRRYEYKLTVGSDTYQVPATKAGVIRVKVKPFSGKKVFKITVLEKGNAVVELKPYKSNGSRKNHTLNWLRDSKKIEFQDVVAEIQETYGENSFMLGSYYEKQKMWVAAMDQYKQYLKENPDDIEMAPYLFRVYKKLRLDKIYRKELEKWKQALME